MDTTEKFRVAGTVLAALVANGGTGSGALRDAIHLTEALWQHYDREQASIARENEKQRKAELARRRDRLERAKQAMKADEEHREAESRKSFPSVDS